MRKNLANCTRALLAALLLPAAVAVAQADEADHLKKLMEHAQDRFAAADADHDGMLTRAEAQKGMPFVAKHFDAIDTGKTGKVSAADITKYIEQRRTAITATPKAEPKTDK